MTQQARLVLSDCEELLQELRSDPVGARWRTRWAATVALLRAAIHVLDKVDGANGDASIRAAVDEAWKQLKKSEDNPDSDSAIFWNFIEEERNNILKEYRPSARQGVIVRPGSVEVNLRTGEQKSFPGGPTTETWKMTSGHFAGHDPRDVVQEAIDWLRQYLDKIDRRAAALRAESGG